jgi:hypothetical protein
MRGYSSSVDYSTIQKRRIAWARDLILLRGDELPDVARERLKSGPINRQVGLKIGHLLDLIKR